MIDDDPYVKKTAAISVAKIYQTSPQYTKDYGFIKLLQNLLQDGNAIVVANAVASLIEISKSAGKNYIKLDKDTLGKLLTALNETNEWGQVYILECVHKYKPKSQKEAEEIIDRIIPRLVHNNPAVVLGGVKNVLKFLDFIKNEDQVKTISRKLAAPLLTLLSAEPEIQYVALRNISFILQKYPSIFDKNIKVFVRYNDPPYVKMEKLDILVKVADNANIDLIISELKEYCNDLDPDFVRKSVRAIGIVAVKVERCAKRAVEILQDLVKQEGADTAL